MTKPTEYELETYEWRKCSEARYPNYCGSCTIETHVRQMRDPDAWIHSSIKFWERDFKNAKIMKAHGLGKNPTFDDCLERLDRMHQGEKAADKRIEELQAKLSLAESFIPDDDAIWEAYQQALEQSDE